MKFYRSVFLLVFSLFLAPLALASNNDDERFLAARDAARAGDRARLDRIAPELKGHVLASYVEYWRILLDIETADPAVVRDFLSRHETSQIAERMRSDWLKRLGKQQQWDAFDLEYPALVQPDQDLRCHDLQRRRLRGDASMLDEAMPLWLNLVEPPEACYPVLEALILEKRVLADAVWVRIRRQIEANKLAGARFTMNYLPASQTPGSALAAEVIDKPMPWLAKRTASATMSRMYRELTALAISRVASNDPRMAAEQLGKFESRLHKAEKGWAWSMIGFHAAKKHLPEAIDWYKKSDDAPLSDELAQWKVRAALRAQDWGAVRETIERMPDALAEQPVWVYWLGRAYRAGGRVADANTLFTKIAGQPNFYSNLADEELGWTITTPPKAPSPTPDERVRVKGNPGLQRSLALFRVNMRSEGVREWNWALRGMSDRELLAASEIALADGVYDRAILAADRTKNEHDYSLRYLSPFSDQVRPAARRQSIDDAWVYGLMRQESRFITNARSTVGASGLMQLMPATARWVARKIGLKDFHPSQVNDTEVNVLLGTSYMRMVLESLDNHPVLASAAYNAGPGRARKWQADAPLEGAIYAETIPFSETRDYVKKVMSNAVYYSALFEGRPQSIKSRLGVIGPRSNGEAKGEELP